MDNKVMETTAPVRERYKVITICGSTRFKTEIEHAQKLLDSQGYLVIGMYTFDHAEGLHMTDEMIDLHVKRHMQKIDMSDAIYVVNPGNYIGEFTRNEIEYAMKHGKEVMYMCT